MKTTFEPVSFYKLTMSGVRQKIDQGDFSTLDQVEDYLNDEAQFYAKLATDQVLIEVLPNDLTEINKVYGTIDTKQDLAFCALNLWMDLNDMFKDAREYYINLKY